MNHPHHQPQPRHLSSSSLPVPVPVPLPVTIVGAGLAGCMSALLIAKIVPKQPVRLIEGRPDLRMTSTGNAEVEEKIGFDGRLTDSAKRSINLALSYRGIQALKVCDLWDKVKNSMITEMKGRLIHGIDQPLSVQPYTHPSPENIGAELEELKLWAVSRVDLTSLLLNELELIPNVELLFDHKCMNVSKNGEVTILNNSSGEVSTFPTAYVIGADGVHSTVRTSMLRHGRFDYSQQYIPHVYKELTVHADQHGHPKMPQNYLHIWPRGDFMLIGLPNPDNTFTCTLFSPLQGVHGLSSLDPKTPDAPTTEELTKIEKYFKTYFPDIPPLIPNFVEQFVTNPTSALKEITVNPWNLDGKICILGDAAHAVVPFYGQGMNCAFEDALVLYELLCKFKGDVEKIFPEFSRMRQPAAKALLKLSNQNYVEMRSHTGKPWFVWKKNIEDALFSWFPSLWKPIYSMVSFSRLPYDEAQKRADFQDKVLFGAGVTSGAVAVYSVAKILSKL